MTERKALIFGSFTEDEIKTLQTPTAKNDITITFGSLDSETLKSVGIFDTNLCELDYSNRSKPSKLENKDVSSNTNYSVVNTSLSEATYAEENGTKGKKFPGCCNGAENLKSSPECSRCGSVPDLPNVSSVYSNVGENVTSLSASSNGLALPASPEADNQAFTKSSISRVTNGTVKAARSLIPRGLVNLGNLCFLNATIQALLSCSPFVQLLQELGTCDIPEAGYPTLRAFLDFISDFDVKPGASSKRKEMSGLEVGSPFRPVMFESILVKFTPDIPNSMSGRPRQEDAQEFLSFVMHQMHDELLKLDGQISNGSQHNALLVSSTTDEEDNDNWETVGPRNKSAVTRTQSFVPSKLSAIFGGQLKSVVKARGSKASATVEPFLLLHLNICPEPVCTLEDALRLFSAPETLEGYKMPAAGKAEVVSASKSMKILELSKIMVLHLMRFSYGSEGSAKLHKPLHFPLELVLGRELLVSPSSEGRRYELVATITHHGRDPYKGHYTADARHPNGSWLRYDDASVIEIPTSKVLHDQAYVLFYKQI